MKKAIEKLLACAKSKDWDIRNVSTNKKDLTTAHNKRCQEFEQKCIEYNQVISEHRKELADYVRAALKLGCTQSDINRHLGDYSAHDIAELIKEK
jgi:hypothetical protein